MGWADCGEDSTGRPIGYCFEATCDFPGCNAKIDRGLSYACAGMHGQEEIGCEGYFCSEHLGNFAEMSDGRWVWICDICCDELEMDI